jgi:hypothetical protein
MTFEVRDIVEDINFDLETPQYAAYSHELIVRPSPADGSFGTLVYYQGTSYVAIGVNAIRLIYTGFRE